MKNIADTHFKHEPRLRQRFAKHDQAQLKLNDAYKTLKFATVRLMCQRQLDFKVVLGLKALRL